MNTVELRPCVCFRFTGLDRTVPHEVPCFGECDATLFISVAAEGWSVQHGSNPEHRSPAYQGDNLLAVCDWVDAVHERSRP